MRLKWTLISCGEVACCREVKTRVNVYCGTGSNLHGYLISPNICGIRGDTRAKPTADLNSLISALYPRLNCLTMTVS